MRFKIHLITVFIFYLGGFCPSVLGQDEGYVMTVNGKLAVDEMGKTLIHEHVVTDFTGTTDANQPFEDQKKAIDVILPNLKHLKDLGFETLFECTPSYIGKNVGLLQQLSVLSGLNIVTNTGYYAAVDKKYLPQHVYTKSSDSLASIWYKEWKDGIADTGIRPGFIKLGVGKGKLDSVEQNIFIAGLILSKKTGMTIAVHTGDGTSIKSQSRLAEENNFDLRRLIWVHAQNGSDQERIQMAEKGIWISLDGVSETRIDEYIEMMVKLREHALLPRLLISHDDGWGVEYINDELVLKTFGNGNKNPYRTVSEILVKKLEEHGFDQNQIDMLLIENPKKAFGILN